MSNFNQGIFRDYDIRGIYPDELNEDTFFNIGRAVAEYFKVKEIAVGRDTRLSSPGLFNALVKGITCQGINVIDLGLISTEINYFASGYYKFPANIIVSASHNPPQYNGLKIVKKGVIPLHGSFGLPDIKKLAVEQNFPFHQNKGNIKKMSVMGDWIKHLLSQISLSHLKGIKVVIDAGNGMGGITWKALLPSLPVKMIPLYFEPDGHFPNHLPDPLIAKNLKDLKARVKTERADLGFAIDGDADRLFVVDNLGNNLSGSLTTAMLAQHLLKKYGPASVLYSVTCSKIVPEIIKNSGGYPVKTRVGHSYIKIEMRKRDAIFAGEHSGHFYFRNNFYADSSTLAGLLFLEYLSLKKNSLSEIRKEFEKYYSSGEINYYVDEKEDIIDNLQEEFKSGSIDKTDGLTAGFDKWWFNVRLSKTEPLIRLNIEADSQEMLSEKLKKLDRFIIARGAKLKID